MLRDLEVELFAGFTVQARKFRIYGLRVQGLRFRVGAWCIGWTDFSGQSVVIAWINPPPSNGYLTGPL